MEGTFASNPIKSRPWPTSSNVPWGLCALGDRHTGGNMDKRIQNARIKPEMLISTLLKGASSETQARIRISGSIILPYEEKGATYHNLSVIISAAKAFGYEVPDHFIFSAGQIFYQNKHLEEVRLSGFVLDGEPNAGGGYTEIKWNTPTAPRFTEGPNGSLTLDPADEGRTHLSAFVVREQEVAFLWNLRDNNLPETSEIALVPHAFSGITGKLPNNPLIAAGLGAIWKGGPRARTLVGGWSETENGNPIYQHAGGRGGRILIYPNLPRNAASPLPAAEALWNFVESLNPFTSDVALAVLAQLCEPSMGNKPKYPLLESVRISSDAILRYKGIQRWGLERQLLQERVFEEMERLRTLHFNVEKYPARNPKTGKWEPEGASWQGDRLFDIVKVEQYQKSLHGDREQIEVSWLVRAGQWAYWWLNAQGRVWIARMARVLLELDHRETRGSAVMAKKIGQRITLLDGTLQPGTLSPLRIDHLLESVGELLSPEKRDKNWAGRTRERFDEAMLKLQEVGVFGRVEWPDGCTPGDLDRNKGWVEKWLAARVQITLPEAPPELPKDKPPALPLPRRQRKSQPRPRKPIAEQQVDGPAIRQARMERGWSQEALARYLDISTPYLSQVENGKRLPSKALVGRIYAWLKGG